MCIYIHLCQKKYSWHLHPQDHQKMSSSTSTTGRISSSYEAAKKAIIDSRVSKRVRSENHDSVSDGDFEFFKKGLFAFELPACSPRKEFLQLNLEKGTSIVCF